MSASGGTATPSAPASANILAGFANVQAAGTTTLVTVPAGRVWVGQVGAAASISNPAATAAAATASASVTVANGTGTAVPGAGAYARVDAAAGANAAGGTAGAQGAEAVTGQRLVVTNNGAGTALIQLVVTVTGGATPQASGWAVGELQ